MLEELIGNTPMIKIKCKYKGKKIDVFAKLEYYNLTGSIKDRVAYYIVNEAIKREELKGEQPIIEATSGNTGISLAAIGSYYKHPVYIFMPDWVSKERIELMRAYGANVTLISRKQGGFAKCIEESKKIAKEKNWFFANQFGNEDNYKAHYETTGKEIVEDLRNLSENIGGFVSGVGTGGTLMGIGDRLKRDYKDIKIVALEPDKMPILSKGKIIGEHKIEGIGDEFVPDLLDKNKIDEIILINDYDAINMARKLSRELGLGVGISSGANFIASVLLADKINENVVTVFADDNKKYLSTDLNKDIDDNEEFESNRIELIK